MSRFDTAFETGGVLIIGAGLAGLFAALKLAPRPVTVLSPDPLGQGASSAWAQGGVAAAVGAGDSPEDHADDTLKAGAGIVDEATARSVAREAAARIEDLARLGAPFDRDEEGHYMLSREAAHGRARVVRVAGDRAGRAIMDALIEDVRATPSISVVEGVIAVDFAVAEGRVIGVFARAAGDRYATPLFFRADATILAAGGLGGLYAVTTNPSRVRGQAMGMAARAGAVIADPEFVQFHPTAIDLGKDPAPLATEALRGEGALLVDEGGRRFMPEVHPDAELAPRDVVARAIFAQIQAGHRPALDARAALGTEFGEKFPTVMGYLQEAGIDPSIQTIPVAPAAHYHMGGVRVDAHGRSSLGSLWVCGEASSTGLHGANRLASNGLLEAVVFAARVAEDVEKQVSESLPAALPELLPRADFSAEGELRNLWAVHELRQTMSDDVGVVRDAEGLKRALRKIARLEREAAGASRSYLNMTTAATMVAAAALRRTESRGGHFRSDFPETDPAWAHRTEITLDEALAIRAAAVEEAR
ncbi:L-aspartate oxidase [Neomegalonema sp.]|uniref:L-aspartate oxidase n=1 Tax=Neomegalonema sp. TaxID=2039713 RepID=UPI002622AD91|nr:L-aspartate oxidase [Neomegalonema sp.]MDD2867093.1 L-aspartate oxidase [Neomegalonema sp.]